MGVGAIPQLFDSWFPYLIGVGVCLGIFLYLRTAKK